MASLSLSKHVGEKMDGIIGRATSESTVYALFFFYPSRHGERHDWLGILRRWLSQAQPPRCVYTVVSVP